MMDVRFEFVRVICGKLEVLFKKFSFFLLQLWRVSESEFQFRTSQGQFLTCDGDDCTVSATAKSPSTSETYEIERNDNSRIHMKKKNGAYLQVFILLLFC